MIDLDVVDITEGIAGAYATKLLADMGARITKIERAGGDPLRTWSAASPDDPRHDTGALFAFLNERKTCVVADDIDVGPHIARADALVVGRESATIVGSEMLARARRSGAVMVTISPFGATGPLADVHADEFTLQAWCGLMSGCGSRDTPPLPMGIGHGQWATGAMAALAVLAARAYHDRAEPAPDAAVEVEVCALEVMAVCLLNYPTLYRDLTGSIAVMSRSGDRPQLVRCKDGWIGLSIFTPQQWDDFANMIGRPDLVGDDRFNSMRGR